LDRPGIAVKGEATVLPLEAAKSHEIAANCLLVGDELLVTNVENP
jgi:hypothetical protein